jgi:membrane protease YdiL (CAAX protease family)
LYRAYVIQQLRELTGSAWIGATVSLFVFVAQHLATWNISHVLGVVLPLGLALTGLYLWRRNLAFVILIHLVIDLPLFLIAAGIMPQIS